MSQKETKVNGLGYVPLGLLFCLFHVIMQQKMFSDVSQHGLTGCRVTHVVDLLIHSTNPCWAHAVCQALPKALGVQHEYPDRRPCLMGEGG